MTPICECGHQMHRHGSRSILVTDHAGGIFRDHQARVQRYRCPDCLTTSGIETPELEEGFKLTRVAADEIITIALSNDIQGCSEVSGVDKSTISRLLTSRADAVLNQIKDIKTCRLQLIRPSVLALVDQQRSTPLGFLPGISSKVVGNFLERIGVETVIPCPETAPYSLSWTKRMAVTLSRTDFALILKGLLKDAAKKVVDMIKLPENISAGSAVQLLTADMAALSLQDNVTLARLAPTGTAARGFLRMRERLISVHMATDLTSARRQLAKWKEDCKDLWRVIFSDVVRFLDSYKDIILSNQYALQPAAAYRGPAILRPANVMTIQLHRKLPRLENQLTLRH